MACTPRSPVMQPLPLTIEASMLDDVADLQLVGEIDLSSAHLLVAEIDAAIEAGARTVVLDFAGVSFVNSTGLGAMVAATKRLRADGGDLVLRRFRGIPASALATGAVGLLEELHEAVSARDAPAYSYGDRGRGAVCASFA